MTSAIRWQDDLKLLISAVAQLLSRRSFKFGDCPPPQSAAEDAGW